MSRGMRSSVGRYQFMMWGLQILVIILKLKTFLNSQNIQSSNNEHGNQTEKRNSIILLGVERSCYLENEIGHDFC